MYLFVVMFFGLGVGLIVVVLVMDYVFVDDNVLCYFLLIISSIVMGLVIVFLFVLLKFY